MHHFTLADTVSERSNMTHVVDLEWTMVMKKHSKIVNGFGSVAGSS